jgi:hypothetical protein
MVSISIANMNEYFIKIILFKMWQRVESGQFDSRSFVGDLSLELKSELYNNDDNLFWEEYTNWIKKEN